MEARRLRLLPMAAAALAMAIGLWTGLYRLGLPLPPAGALAPWHGMLMISGFLGTLISLERAVALNEPWGYGAPGFAAAGFVVLLAGLPTLAAILFVMASGTLVLASLALLRRELSLATIGLVVAAACWAIAGVEWLAGAAAPRIAAWGLLFLILTIAAERLEMSRLLQTPRIAELVFAGVVLAAILGAAAGELERGQAPLTGIGFLGLALWLFRYDIARRTIRNPAQARFAAACMLLGHAWLAVSGLILLAMRPDNAAWLYDAALHAVTIGFVLSMIFGHAPIILPAITGARLPYTAAFYAPLALLHVSAALRVGADLGQSFDWRNVSGVLTLAALLGYAATAVVGAAGKLPLGRGRAVRH